MTMVVLPREGAIQALRARRGVALTLDVWASATASQYGYVELIPAAGWRYIVERLLLRTGQGSWMRWAAGYVSATPSGFTQQDLKNGMPFDSSQAANTNVSAKAGVRTGYAVTWTTGGDVFASNFADRQELVLPRPIVVRGGGRLGLQAYVTNADFGVVFDGFLEADV